MIELRTKLLTNFSRKILESSARRLREIMRLWRKRHVWSSPGTKRRWPTSLLTSHKLEQVEEEVEEMQRHHGGNWRPALNQNLLSSWTWEGKIWLIGNANLKCTMTSLISGTQTLGHSGQCSRIACTLIFRSSSTRASPASSTSRLASHLSGTSLRRDPLVW